MNKKSLSFSWLLLTAGLLFLQPCQAQKTVKIQFDSNKEVSGRKLAIRDISPGIPSNWDGFNFVVLEFRITTLQRFQWCDQDLTGRRDGENYNCGFVDVTDRPYPFMVEAVSRTAGKLLGVHNGITPPTTLQPVKARGHGAIPDVWQ